MSPVLSPGDLVLVSRINAQEPIAGDIVVFWRNQDLIAHRILKKWKKDQDTCFGEKGDATLTYGLIQTENIVGKIIKVRKKHRLLYFSSSAGRIASRFLSLWYYSTTMVVNRLWSSPSLNTRRVGEVISILTAWLSNVIVRGCCVVWVLAAVVNNRSANQI
jgi:hypothetical protein